MKFNIDKNIDSIVEAFALDAIEVASNNFEINLDWTEESVENVENILDVMHKSLLEESPSDDDIWYFSKMFGSYLGEVYCRNHKAKWGMITNEGESYPGLETSNKVLYWPWSKVFNRIKNGNEDNVFDYYNLIK